MPQFYANPLPIFRPAMRLISSITNALQAVITTSFANNYIVGTKIRLVIPGYLGMPQANLQVVTVLTILGPTSFTIDLNTTAYEPFVVPDPLPAHVTTTALAVPVGEINGILTAATQNILPFR